MEAGAFLPVRDNLADVQPRERHLRQRVERGVRLGPHGQGDAQRVSVVLVVAHASEVPPKPIVMLLAGVLGLGVRVPWNRYQAKRCGEGVEHVPRALLQFPHKESAPSQHAEPHRLFPVLVSTRVAQGGGSPGGRGSGKSYIGGIEGDRC